MGLQLTRAPVMTTRVFWRKFVSQIYASDCNGEKTHTAAMIYLRLQHGEAIVCWAEAISDLLKPGRLGIYSCLIHAALNL